MTGFGGFLLLGRAFLDHISSRFWTKAGAALILVLLADHLFVGEQGLAAGSTLGFFGLILLFFVWDLRVPSPEAHDYFLGALALGLCLALFNDPSVIAAGLLWTVLALLVLRPSSGTFIDARDLVLKLTVFTLSASIRPLKDLGLLQKAARRHPRARIRVTPFILPLAALILFGALLIWANPILEDLASRLNFDTLGQPPRLDRLVLWAIVGIIAWNLLRSSAIHLPKAAESQVAVLDGRVARFFSPMSVLAALILCNAIFALENGLDIAYLWTGETLPGGMTYAQYAHRGAYPLILTALLAGAFVLIALGRGSPTEQHQGVRTLVYLWLAQNVFLVASAILRTLNYVEDYSLTLLRLAALIWMGLVGLGLVLIVLRIVFDRSGRWLINANALAAAGVLYIAAFVDLPGIVANFNVRHAFETAGRGVYLDIGYLRELGPASLPALDWFIANGKSTRQAFAVLVRDELYAKLQDHQTDWHSWTWAGERLLASLPPPPPPAAPRMWKAP